VTARELTPTEAAGLVRPIDSIGFGLGPANPHSFFNALSARDDWEDLQLGGALVLGLFGLFTHPKVHYRAGFFGPAERYYRSVGGDVQHVPAGFRQFEPMLRRFAPRIMAVQCSRDFDGNFNLSLHVGATQNEIFRAARDPERLLIVEVNDRLPVTRPLSGHSVTIPAELVDVVITSDQAPFELPVDVTTDEDAIIAEIAGRFIHPHATLQTGIGAIPTMVAQHLAERDGGEYGIHSEMFTTGLFELHRAGKVTNSHKSLFPGVSVTTFALGNQEMYDWLHNNPEVAFAPVSLVNDPTVIGSNGHFVSINGAITVDLFGQIVADSVAGKQFSGVGGHEDFVAAAGLNLENTSLICLPSTIDIDGVRHSRIVAQLPLGSVVSTPRHHTAVVVTEFGAADLRGATVRERAHALAEIAHPDFREELHAAATSVAL
jgi:acyl-CoA hydrolase